MKMKIEEIFSGIQDFYYYLINGIPNVIRWIPTLMKDRHWDEIYLFIIIKKKLEHMEKLQRKYGNSVNAEKYANDIRYAINLLDRIIDHPYSDKLEKQDLDELFIYLRKHIQEWWD